MKFKLNVIYLYLVLIAISINVSFAQRDNGHSKLKAIKIGMITQELNLSETQAQKFWPLYNNYSQEKTTIHRSIRIKNHVSKTNDLDEDDLLQNQDDILSLKKEDIELTRKYRDTFLKVISVQQYAKLMETEKKFNDLLLQKLKERGRN